MRKLLALGLMVCAISLVGCSKKKDIKPEDSYDSSGEQSGEVSQGDIDSGRTDSDSGNAMGLETIHFPYDSFDIVDENKEVLRNNIKILKDNPTLKVQVEGHCDERGGIQYNLALGEKRANAIVRQITAGGIAKSRVTMISMGKEKPAVSGSNEEAWSKNRRGNFVITAK